MGRFRLEPFKLFVYIAGECRVSACGRVAAGVFVGAGLLTCVCCVVLQFLLAVCTYSTTHKSSNEP